MKRIPLTADAVGPVARGHPWVYADGLQGKAPVGDIVQLLDTRNRPVAWGIADEGAIAIRVLGRHPEPIERLLRNRIERAVALRRQFIPKDTNAMRIINGAGDGLPGLVVDQYDQVLVVRLYSKAWEPHLSACVTALKSNLAPSTILRKLGVRNVDQGQSGCEHLFGSPLPPTLIIQENGLRFLVRPIEGQKTGFFLDQRQNRAFLGSRCQGLRVSNLFSYTGGFSVYAAAGGAKHVTSVDISASALADAQENFRLNGLDPDQHQFLATDVFQWSPEGASPDLLICDPPSLTRGKRADKAARQAYRELATRCGRHLQANGFLATFSCTARLDNRQWMETIRDGLRKSGRWSLLWQAGEPFDHPTGLEHPEARYLKFALFRRH